MGIRATHALPLKPAKGISLDDMHTVEPLQIDDLIFNREQPQVFLKAGGIL